MKAKAVITVLAASCILLPLARAQDEEKIRKLFEDAIQAMGGEAYSKVTDIVSEGNAFAFSSQGESSGILKFDEWTKLPDKNRFEVGPKKKERDVQVFNLEKNEGWILQGQKPTRDATPDEMKDFRDLVKHKLDNIFRTRWKDPANKLFYMGPGEGVEVRLEVVKLLDPENDEISIYFDRASRLPVKIEYHGVDARRGIQIRTVKEFSQWHVIDGVNTPMRVDTYRNGKKASQLYALKITYNSNLQDSFFSKPEPPK